MSAPWTKICKHTRPEDTFLPYILECDVRSCGCYEIRLWEMIFYCRYTGWHKLCWYSMFVDKSRCEIRGAKNLKNKAASVRALVVLYLTSLVNITVLVCLLNNWSITLFCVCSRQYYEWLSHETIEIPRGYSVLNTKDPNGGRATNMGRNQPHGIWMTPYKRQNLVYE